MKMKCLGRTSISGSLNKNGEMITLRTGTATSDHFKSGRAKNSGQDKQELGVTVPLTSGKIHTLSVSSGALKINPSKKWSLKKGTVTMRQQSLDQSCVLHESVKPHI